MKKLKEWLKNPHGQVLAFLYVLTVLLGVAAIVVSALGWFDFPLNIASYAIYGSAAVLVGLSVYTLVKIAPTAKQALFKH